MTGERRDHRAGLNFFFTFFDSVFSVRCAGDFVAVVISFVCCAGDFVALVRFAGAFVVLVISLRW